MKRVAVGLSGGVDSAVSAAVLKKRGFEVVGVFLECWRAPGCRVDEDRKDAMDVARKLGIQFEVLDFKKEYRERVVDYFYREYEAGRTPNPDVMCNREIKFGMFYEWGMNSGYDFIATGHYARIRRIREETSSKKQDTLRLGSVQANKSQIPNYKYQLLRGVDERKDQSYFLYQLREEQLGRVLFPLGDLRKQEVRELAKKFGLPVAEKPDSQGICFIGPVSVREFLKDLGMREKPGKVFLKLKAPRQRAGRQSSNVKTDALLSDEVEIGVHEGAWFYTVGQRHGFKIHDLRFMNREQEELFGAAFDRSKMPPLYVVEKDVRKNILIVGTREMLMRNEFEVGEIHWISPGFRFQVSGFRDLRVRMRHGGQLLRAELKTQNSTPEGPPIGRASGQAKLKTTNKKLKVRLSEPVFGVASGQSVVFYDDEVVLGGGVIK